MKEYRLFIDGDWVAARSGVIADDLDPATDDVFARVHQAGPEDLEDALAAAYRACEAWDGTLAREREEILLRAADGLAGRPPGQAWQGRT
jgi:aldehyde dehydrogenase (NAD+)